MRWTLVLVVLVLFVLQCVPAKAAIDPADRRWIAIAILSLVSEGGSSEPGIFYSWKHQFEPGILVRARAGERLTLGVGITENTFALGPSLRIDKSRFHLSGGVASDQDRMFTYPFVCLSWRWITY